jgi:hypothetical protein
MCLFVDSKFSANIVKISANEEKSHIVVDMAFLDVGKKLLIRNFSKTVKHLNNVF